MFGKCKCQCHTHHRPDGGESHRSAEDDVGTVRSPGPHISSPQAQTGLLRCGGSEIAREENHNHYRPAEQTLLTQILKSQSVHNEAEQDIGYLPGHQSPAIVNV